LRLNDGVEQGDLGIKMGQEVESLTEMMEEVDEEDDIEYMPPRAQGESSRVTGRQTLKSSRLTRSGIHRTAS